MLGQHHRGRSSGAATLRNLMATLRLGSRFLPRLAKEMLRYSTAPGIRSITTLLRFGTTFLKNWGGIKRDEKLTWQNGRQLNHP